MIIQIDVREDVKTIRAFRQACPTIEIAALESGDIVQGNYAIEHKKIDDFWDSLEDGRLFEQIEKMRLNFDKFAIIVSGQPKDILYNNVGIGTMASCIVRDAPVIFCGNLPTTVKVSLATLEKWNDGKVRTSNPSINKKRTKDPQLNTVTGLPLVDDLLGNALLDHFGSIKNIVNASMKELQAVPKIGPKKAKLIYSCLNAPRW